MIMASGSAKSLLIVLLSLFAAQCARAQGAAPQAPEKLPDVAPFLKEKKVAIVIGISDYPVESGFPKLQFAAKDAQDLAAALEKQGYQVQLLTDQHKARHTHETALQALIPMLGAGDDAA